MSDENKSAPDISKVISILMENPDIIERISSLLKSENQSAPPTPEKEEIAAEPT